MMAVYTVALTRSSVLHTHHVHNYVKRHWLMQQHDQTIGSENF